MQGTQIYYIAWSLKHIVPMFTGTFLLWLKSYRQNHRHKTTFSASLNTQQTGRCSVFKSIMVAKTHLCRCPPAHSTFGRDNFGEIIGLKLPFWRAQIHSKPTDVGYSNILHCLVAKTHLRRCPPAYSTFGRDNFGTIIGLKLPFRRA
jgi:hypothetical protein